MKPISNRMLCCTATLYTQKSIDEDRNVVWENPVSLSKVYLTLTEGTTNTGDGKESSDSMTLIYDCWNSSPRGLTFKTGQKIVFDGREYFINHVNPCYADGLHHYELGLV